MFRLLPFSLALSFILFYFSLPLSVSASDSDSDSDSPLHYSPVGRVLVLGSGGLIGSALHSSLVALNYSVLEVRNRRHLDLRNSSSVSALVGPVSFAYFLACEVGGSKFIDSRSNRIQRDIIENNMLIYQHVLNLLHSNGIPYLFTSSYLQSQYTAYGAVKRLGEQWIAAANSDHAGKPLGRVVRLWNIYGAERPSVKSHVLSDWIYQCNKHRIIQALTDGTEARQFLHARDTANALILLMRHFDDMDFVTDLSSNVWLDLSQLANTIQLVAKRQFNFDCIVNFADEKARVRDKTNPVMDSAFYRLSGWRPAISLEQGIEEMFRVYQSEPGTNRGEPVHNAGTNELQWVAGNAYIVDETMANIATNQPEEKQQKAESH